MNDFFKDFDFFENHHSSDDFKSHGSGSFFKNLFDEDEDDMFNPHFGSFSSMFGAQEDGGNLHTFHSEQSFTSGKITTNSFCAETLILLFQLFSFYSFIILIKINK